MALKDTIKKETGLISACIKMKVMDRMEDIVTFLFMSIGIILRITFSLVFFKSLYAQVPLIAGWSFPQLLILLGTWELILGIAWSTYVRGGYKRIIRSLERGEMDKMIVRPFSLKRYYIYDNNDLIFQSPQFVLSIGMIVYGMANLHAEVHIFTYLIALCAAVVIHYNLFVIAMSINFWTVVEQMDYLFSQANNIGRYPVDIFKGPVKYFLTLIIPLACIYTFPAQIFLGQISMTNLLILVAVTAVFSWLGTTVWNAGLKRYESSSY